MKTLVDTFKTEKSGGSGGITPIKDMLFFEHLDQERCCHWKVIKNTQETKVIVFEVFHDDPLNRKP